MKNCLFIALTAFLCSFFYSAIGQSQIFGLTTQTSKYITVGTVNPTNNSTYSISYPSTNAIDGNNATAWMAWSSNSEWIDFNLPSLTKITSIQLIWEYPWSGTNIQLFANNTVIETIAVPFNGNLTPIITTGLSKTVSKIRINTKSLISSLPISLKEVIITGYASKVEYTYDANGNRISRGIIYLSGLKSSSDSKTNESQVGVPQEFDGDLKISFYPNPTKGILRIEIASNTEIDKLGEISIFNMNGALVEKKADIDIENMINLSGLPSGIYILRVVLNNRIKEWKLIKE